MYFHGSILKQALQTSFSRQYFHPVHGVSAIAFTSLFLILRSLVSAARYTDRICYPEYYQQPINNPIYITGNPRSGTTFLHRLLTEDRHFTYTKLYHTIFPAITFYRIFSSLSAIDRNIGGRLSKLVNWLDRQGFRGWDSIHKTQLNRAEEDEQLFMFTLLSPVITLLFPYYQELEESLWVDRLPQPTRHRLMSYYIDCLQRHLYATGSEKTLLIKNTTSTGRLRSTIAALPQVCIIHMVRHPYECIPSLLSMYAASWNTFVRKKKVRSQANLHLAQLYASYYRERMQIFREFSHNYPDQFLEISYQDLVNSPLSAIERIYQKFDLKLNELTYARFQQVTDAAKHYKSQHSYSLEKFGIDRKMLYEQMPDVFDYYGFES
ncbi:sulfotransferase family protein [Roseofilum casamattae]|uniref:Sulfotransferase n=1 Tax=Roseofilum casamattae BLCC-M143 TaxID=3022442 RepID=A0ABT7BSZ4_9CYAN|nr:sulfotransferase [Roseofilum casamattae]MDJ1181626.1 sulfotransferase [Roseofilum casamattae BLCC-M143]